MRALPILLVLPTLACAAARASAPSVATAEREILDLERAWGDAEVRRDAAALDAILDDRFVFTYGAEAPVDKATILKRILANDDPTPSTTTEQHVIVHGDVAITTGVDTVDRVVDGKPAKKSFRHTTTFAYTDGRWRALAVHEMGFDPASSDAAPARGARERNVLAHELSPAFGKKPRVELFEVGYGPGGSTPPHRHGCPVVGYVLRGALRMQLQGDPVRVYGPGEAFYEDPSDLHALSENAGQGETRFLAFFVCDDDRPLYVKAAPR
jgi:quercetin dioxygenase-like cupin family protein/ketosteroid isomerase-like protein